MIEIWTEKYRPKVLDDVVGHEAVVERLKAFVKEKSVPNMLFAGTAGVGKTTCAIALAKELYGEGWSRNFMETNASDERGIDVVRSKIKDFARIKPLGAEFKIIFLDESDALTPEAQQALRRTMEKYTHSTRFILSCNYSSKLIAPIQSRCAVFRFGPGSDEAISKYVGRVAKAEGLDVTKDGMAAVLLVSSGDFRKATNVIQSVSVLSKKVDEKSVYEVAATLHPKEVKDVLNLALSCKFLDARKKLYDLMINRGLSGLDVIKAIHREILGLDVDDKCKAQLIDKLGEYEFRIVEGGQEDLQIEAFLAQLVALKD